MDTTRTEIVTARAKELYDRALAIVDDVGAGVLANGYADSAAVMLLTAALGRAAAVAEEATNRAHRRALRKSVLAAVDANIRLHLLHPGEGRA